MLRTAFFVFSLFWLSTEAQKNSNHYTINGKLNKLQAGKIYLTIYHDAGPENDSAKINNGTFSFKGSIDKPTVAFLSVPSEKNPGTNAMQFYIEPANIMISGDGDVMSNLKISGSSLNEDNSILKERMKDISAWEARNSEVYAVAAKEKNKKLLDSLDQVDWLVLAAKRKVASKFIFEHPASLSAAIAIQDNYGYYADAADVQPLYNALNPEIRNSSNGKDIKKILDAYNNVAVGKTMPDITQKYTSGNKQSLSSLRGHYVLIDFWASWCGPCRRENPNIVKTYEQYHPKGFEIFAVSYDSETGAAKWKKAINDDHLTWHQISELKGWQSSTSDQFYIKAIPANFLIDKNGVIIAKNLFGKLLAEKLASLM